MWLLYFYEVWGVWCLGFTYVIVSIVRDYWFHISYINVIFFVLEIDASCKWDCLGCCCVHCHKDLDCHGCFRARRTFSFIKVSKKTHKTIFFTPMLSAVKGRLLTVFFVQKQLHPAYPAGAGVGRALHLQHWGATSQSSVSPSTRLLLHWHAGHTLRYLWLY